MSEETFFPSFCDHLSPALSSGTPWNDGAPLIPVAHVSTSFYTPQPSLLWTLRGFASNSPVLSSAV